MINKETKLRLQAHLDNELSDRETREMAAWLDREPEARALYNELNNIKHLLVNNEPEAKLPESREFYWSKIERTIRQESAKAPASGAATGRFPWWVRVFAPALGVVVLLVSALSVVKFGTGPQTVRYLHEVETPLEETSAISFRSQSAGMTVVWVETQVY